MTQGAEPDPVGRWRASYAPGDWLVLSGPTSLVVLQPASPEWSTLISTIWEGVLGAGTMTELASVLARHRIDQMPSFAAFFWAGDEMRSLVRGDVRLVEPASGDTLADGHGIQTWSELGLGQVPRVRVDLPQSVPGPRLQLPLVVGVVTASSLLIDTSETALVFSPQSAAPEEAPRPLAETAAVPHVPEPPITAADTTAEDSERAEGHGSPAEGAAPQSAATPESASVEPGGEPTPEPGPESTQDSDVGEPEPTEPTAYARQPELPESPPPVATGPAASPPPVGPPVGAAVGTGLEPTVGLPDLGPWGLQLEQPAPEPVASAPVAAPPVEVGGPSPGPEGGPELPATGDDNETADTALMEAVPPQQPRRSGVAILRSTTGQVVQVDRPVLIGRSPVVDRSTGAPEPLLMVVPSPGQDISRTHLLVEPRGWQVEVTDLHSTNGTLLLVPDSEIGPQRLEPGRPVTVGIGCQLELGDGVTISVDPAE
ncbi:hypothetical protein GCM10009841_07410 [Microlunatus panaciterrae]|uniref:FHA domain-containing protein n=1 Tax=Microlunatus panaciterrae TaxID=400768 RepID=A0ABS2RHY3_9ACTN|nr:FHA domain-containing protein [Microlunatus panaciterrae]MBM7798605.1 hypothetical protein [Microlunatus panaciterrae]